MENTKAPRIHDFTVCITEEASILFAEMAKETGKSIGEFMSDTVCDTVGKIIRDQKDKNVPPESG